MELEVLDTYDTGIPGQFYQQLGRLRSTGGLEGRVDFEGSTYREKFMLINKLQDYDVLCKIVPQNLEGLLCAKIQPGRFSNGVLQLNSVTSIEFN
jgi:hypothetical protein